MSSSRIDKPTPITVRTVSFFAAGFVLLAVATQMFYVVALAPQLPANFELNFSGRAPTSAIMATPGGLAVAGWIIVVLGLVAAIVALVLARSGARGAYVSGVLTCILMPGFVGSLLGNAFSVLAGPVGLIPAVVALIIGVAIGMAAIVLAPRVTGQPATR
jgi:hypothetical protein